MNASLPTTRVAALLGAIDAVEFGGKEAAAYGPLGGIGQRHQGLDRRQDLLRCVLAGMRTLPAVGFRL